MKSITFWVIFVLCGCASPILTKEISMGWGSIALPATWHIETEMEKNRVSASPNRDMDAPVFGLEYLRFVEGEGHVPCQKERIYRAYFALLDERTVALTKEFLRSDGYIEYRASGTMKDEDGGPTWFVMHVLCSPTSLVFITFAAKESREESEHQLETIAGSLKLMESKHSPRP